MMEDKCPRCGGLDREEAFPQEHIEVVDQNYVIFRYVCDNCSLLYSEAYNITSELENN
tara:strand:+ start:83 stop:256 length:174 start_codon:yes stop_codon:yes gene_type:complete